MTENSSLCQPPKLPIQVSARFALREYSIRFMRVIQVGMWTFLIFGAAFVQIKVFSWLANVMANGISDQMLVMGWTMTYSATAAILIFLSRAELRKRSNFVSQGWWVAYLDSYSIVTKTPTQVGTTDILRVVNVYILTSSFFWVLLSWSILLFFIVAFLTFVILAVNQRDSM